MSCKQHGRLGPALVAGLVAGVISALVKSGFEGLIPPRTAETTPPPMLLLEKLGVNVDALNYHWLGYTINWGGNGVHIVFSVVIAMFYCALVELFPRIKLLHGLFFGFLVSVFAHGLIVPLLGLSGWLWTAGYQPIMSEFVGTAFWMWTIEAIRQSFREKQRAYV
ncbi:DUF1440 domain-containing protein [Pantoea sp. 1.19]|uniref:DUF1440 domain-containing protein n=1 Tax=Pantoea sp. 1.19 TaxID=1925589 RepID=UPI000948BCC5|nr:DUF1440 domain-containing protein [Pantoea sp. 1.19]